MDCKRQEIIDITICSRKLASLEGFLRTLWFGPYHRQIRLAFKYMEEEKWGRNPRCTNWMDLHGRPWGHSE